MSTSNSGGRRIFLQIWKNFVSSFSARKSELKGNLVGEDLFGNKFYENTHDLTRGKRFPRRSFEPTKEMHFDVDNMSAEWDAWLRHRRKEAPTIEELKTNTAMAEAKQQKAKLLSGQGEKPLEEQKRSDTLSYPQYDEYEVNPGKGHTKFKE